MKMKFFSRKKKTNDFSEQPVCEGKIEFGNIWPINNTILPNNLDDCVNFQYDYSKAYLKVSNNKVNVRFKYPYGGSYRANGIEGTEEIFAKLNFYQRTRLAFKTKKTAFHLNPVVFIATTANIVFGAANIYIAIINANTHSDFQNITVQIIAAQSNQLKSQSESLEESLKINTELLQILKKQGIDIPKDSLFGNH